MIRKLTCGARVHVVVQDNRYIRQRCRDGRCHEAAWAKAHNQIAIHVWDLESDLMWTEYEQREASDGGNSHLQP